MSAARVAALPGVNRYALEVRALLDLVALELHRLELPATAVVGVHAAAPELAEDLGDRLWPERTVGAAARPDVAVHLLDLEEDGLPEAFEVDALIVAFRNAWSHKRLRGPGWPALPYGAVARRVAASHRVVAAHGVMTPGTLAGLALAGVANAAGRYDAGFALADRAALVPSTTGFLRVLCPYGLIVARRRS